MAVVCKTILCLLAGIALAECYCPYDKIHAFGACKLQITCIGTISSIQLPSKCLESSNDPVSVQVNLNDAIQRFDNNIDKDFLKTITSLKISARWQKSSLSILQYTTKLQILNLAHIGLEEISGPAFYYLSLIEDINLSHNKLIEIEEIFEFEMPPYKLRKLSLAYNAIEDVPNPAFAELTALTELDLSFNRIVDLSEEPFFNLTNLEVLKLNDNRIKDLNGAVNSLWNLKHLYLRGNEIQNVDDESLKIIEHLETFDVSKNQLKQLKPIMFSRHWNHFGNHSICKIILSENHISSVPNGTAKEISSRYTRNSEENSVELFTELDLSVNSITTIEYNAFQSLIRVVSLNLSSNRIMNFVVNANHLTYIRYLNLSSNFISHLYFESFSLMDNLQKLDLSYNKLDFIPEMTFTNNHNLQLVNMTYNGIEKLDGIHITMFHPNGSILDLSNNGLFKLRIPYGEAIHLDTLILNSNNITNASLIDLRQQTDLRIIDMSKNLIQELHASSLLLPRSLVTLDLSGNKLRQIGPSTFHTLGHLYTLRLGHNQLTQIEYGAFQGLLILRNLDLSYNRIRILDSKLLMDLKSLQTLSIRSNHMIFLDSKAWYGHKIDLSVFVDNNNFTCEWLARAISDFNNGFSRMRPKVLVAPTSGHSVEGVPCVADKNAKLTVDSSQYITADDRLLMTNQKILETLREQNYYLKNFIFRTMYEVADKAKK